MGQVLQRLPGTLRRLFLEIVLVPCGRRGKSEPECFGEWEHCMWDEIHGSRFSSLLRTHVPAQCELYLDALGTEKGRLHSYLDLVSLRFEKSVRLVARHRPVFSASCADRLEQAVGASGRRRLRGKQPPDRLDQAVG